MLSGSITGSTASKTFRGLRPGSSGRAAGPGCVGGVAGTRKRQQNSTPGRVARRVNTAPLHESLHSARIHVAQHRSIGIASTKQSAGASRTVHTTHPGVREQQLGAQPCFATFQASLGNAVRVSPCNSGIPTRSSGDDESRAFSLTPEPVTRLGPAA